MGSQSLVSGCKLFLVYQAGDLGRQSILSSEAGSSLLIVSACLAGFKCSYNDRANTHPRVRELVARGKAIPLCPERMGGFPIPRPPVEICGGSGEDVLDGRAKVLTKDGEDRTDFLVRGARETVWIARLLGTKKAFLKSKSPSCGYGKIYDGSFRSCLRQGNGVTAAALLREGVKVMTEEELESFD